MYLSGLRLSCKVSIAFYIDQEGIASTVAGHEPSYSGPWTLKVRAWCGFAADGTNSTPFSVPELLDGCAGYLCAGFMPSIVCNPFTMGFMTTTKQCSVVHV